MSYIGAAFLILFLLGLTSAGWYWLFKRFERRMSERLDDVTARVNENFGVLEVMMDRVYDLPVKSDKTHGMLGKLRDMTMEAERKLDILQGLLLVIKQDRVIESAMEVGRKYREDGLVEEGEIERLEEMLKEMKLENLSRY